MPCCKCSNSLTAPLNKKNKDINKTDVPALENATTNNNVFIGSTTDLQRMLQDVKTEKPTAKVNNVIDITPRIKDE